jgi:hypothetical protein
MVRHSRGELRMVNNVSCCNANDISCEPGGYNVSTSSPYLTTLQFKLSAGRVRAEGLVLCGGRGDVGDESK